LQLVRLQHVCRVVGQPLDGQVDEGAHPRRLLHAAAVVDVQPEVVGDVRRQQRHQRASSTAVGLYEEKLRLLEKVRDCLLSQRPEREVGIKRAKASHVIMGQLTPIELHIK
jgi:hypothetical protein